MYYDRETDSYRYPEGYALGKPYDYFWNEGNGADMTVYQDSLNPFYNNSTDLMAYYLRPAHATNANIQVRGGAEGIAYSVGLGFYDEAGTLRVRATAAFSAFSNLTFKPAHHLYGNFRFYLAYTDNNRSRKGWMPSIRRRRLIPRCRTSFSPRRCCPVLNALFRRADPPL